jgi:6,7-dimethyl-8-ribityllumazine synthase
MSDQSPHLDQIPGISQLSGARLVILHTAWNSAIVNALVSGCERILKEYKILSPEKIAVPGAFELPFSCRRYLETHAAQLPDALIALGCVIRGETPHFEYICQAVTQGLMQINLEYTVPVIFGVLTVETEAQAWERTGGIHGHKGAEAALAALQMIVLNRGWNS